MCEGNPFRVLGNGFLEGSRGGFLPRVPESTYIRLVPFKESKVLAACSYMPRTDAKSPLWQCCKYNDLMSLEILFWAVDTRSGCLWDATVLMFSETDGFQSRGDILYFYSWLKGLAASRQVEPTGLSWSFFPSTTDVTSLLETYPLWLRYDERISLFFFLSSQPSFSM